VVAGVVAGVATVGGAAGEEAMLGCMEAIV